MQKERKTKELLQINHQSLKPFKILYLEKAWRILASLRDHGTIKLRKKKHEVNLQKNIYNLQHLFWSPMYTQLVWGEGHGTI